MALPKISYPIFELTLPSTKQNIKYRPFLVKEEKILLTAQVSGESTDIVNSIRQVINNCILTEGVSIDSLTTFDLEYVFIKIRAKSVNNVVTLAYRDLEDEKRYEFEVDLDTIEIKEDPAHSKKIEIDSEKGLIMTYPSADVASAIKMMDGEMDVFFEILKGCIESVYDRENVYNVKDTPPEELDEFVQSLDVNTFKKIQDFFTTMPKLYYEIKYTNSLGKEKTIPLTTLNDFFTLG
jgi:hypothetical protein